MLEAERNRVFESWIDAHKAILFKVARVYGATHSDREDLFQEVVLQVWHSVEAYRGDCAATTWIYRVALNTAIGAATVAIYNVLTVADVSVRAAFARTLASTSPTTTPGTAIAAASPRNSSNTRSRVTPSAWSWYQRVAAC